MHLHRQSSSSPQTCLLKLPLAVLFPPPGVRSAASYLYIISISRSCPSIRSCLSPLLYHLNYREGSTFTAGPSFLVDCPTRKEDNVRLSLACFVIQVNCGVCWS